MAAKFFTGLPMDGPDPECVQGYGEPALAQGRDKPKSHIDHSRGGSGDSSRRSARPAKGPIPLKLLAMPAKAPQKFCNESPV